MKLRNLSLDTVRTLVISKDLGGFRRAAAYLGRTPSAISLQMKRLRDDVGAELFARNGRTLDLTDIGEVVLRYGRKMLALNDELLDTVHGASLAGNVRVGFSQDFAETVLPQVLAIFTRLYPLVQVDVRIDATEVLADAVEDGILDVALLMGEEDRRTAQVLGTIEVGWIASPNFVAPTDQRVIPLILLGAKCVFRRRAVALLERASVEWREAVVSPSVAAAWASAVGGVGVTARTKLGMPQSLTFDQELFGLPSLGSFPVTLHALTSEGNLCLSRLREIMAEQAIASLVHHKAHFPTRRIKDKTIEHSQKQNLNVHTGGSARSRRAKAGRRAG